MNVLRAGLIGDHISQSQLGGALEIMCADRDMTLEYEPIDTASDPGFDFAATVARCRAQGWHGISVTHPHKAAAAEFAGENAADAIRQMGASNLLIFGAGLKAHNTDFTGFLAAWHAVFGPRLPGRVAMAGAGGVARALGPALAQLGATDIAVWDLDPELARMLADRIGAPARAIAAADASKAIRQADGLVNATSLGMNYNPGTAFDPADVDGQDWAFDAVYTPTDTVFLQRAAQQGSAILSGFDLFRFQAMKTFEAYTGFTPDPAATLPGLDTLRPKEGIT